MNILFLFILNPQSIFRLGQQILFLSIFILFFDNKNNNAIYIETLVFINMCPENKDIIKNNINEIDGIDIYFLNEKNETALQKLSYHESKYIFDKSLGVYKKEIKTISLYPGENPNLGLDEHGNIYLENDSHFPILMGGWDFLNSEGQQIKVMDPINIIFE